MSQLPDLASHSSGLTEEGYISVEKGGLEKVIFVPYLALHILCMFT